MAVSLRSRVEYSLELTAHQVRPGHGKWPVRISGLFLDDIQRRLGRRFPEEVTPRLAARVNVVEKDLGGDAFVVDKKRDGLFAVADAACILCRDMSWMRTLTTSYANSSLEAEPVTLTLKRETVHGLRIRDHTGESLVLGLDFDIVGGDPGGPKTVRDGMLEIINGSDAALASTKPPDTRHRDAPKSSSVPSRATDPSVEHQHAAGARERGMRCSNADCEAFGLATPLSSCDVCGRKTTFSASAMPRADSQSAAELVEQGERRCRNPSCEAFDLPTPLSRCDVCGADTRHLVKAQTTPTPSSLQARATDPAALGTDSADEEAPNHPTLGAP